MELKRFNRIFEDKDFINTFKINIFKGYYTEYCVKRYYDITDNIVIKNTPNKNSKNYNNEYFEEGWDIHKHKYEDAEVFKKKLMKMLVTKGCPDFIIFPRDKYSAPFFIEAKSDNAKLTNQQIECAVEIFNEFTFQTYFLRAEFLIEFKKPEKVTLETFDKHIKRLIREDKFPKELKENLLKKYNWSEITTRGFDYKKFADKKKIGLYSKK